MLSMFLSGLEYLKAVMRTSLCRTQSLQDQALIGGDPRLLPLQELHFLLYPDWSECTGQLHQCVCVDLYMYLCACAFCVCVCVLWTCIWFSVEFWSFAGRLLLSAAAMHCGKTGPPTTTAPSERSSGVQVRGQRSDTTQTHSILTVSIFNKTVNL